MTKPKPKEGLKITFSTDTYERKVETTVQHLSKLSTEASTPLVITSRPSKETSVKPEPPIEAQEDSDARLGNRGNQHPHITNKRKSRTGLQAQCFNGGLQNLCYDYVAKGESHLE